MAVNMTRRSFIKGAAAVSMAAVFSGVMAGCAPTNQAGGANQTGTFNIGGGQNIQISVLSCPKVDPYQEVTPTLRVVNNSGRDIKIGSLPTLEDISNMTLNDLMNYLNYINPLSRNYYIVPTVAYTGGAGGALNINYSNSTLDNITINNGNIAEGYLAVPVKDPAWTAVTLTLTLTEKVLDTSGKLPVLKFQPVKNTKPIVFTFRK